MKTFFNFTGHNIAAAPENQSDERIFRLNSHANRPSITRGRRRDFMRERLAAQERERQIREAEDKRIQQINERLNTLSNRVNAIGAEMFELEQGNLFENQELMENLGKELSQLESSIAMLTGQIAHIHTARAEREQNAIEREFVRQQQEMEERMRERERIAREKQEARLENKTEDELEEAAERAIIRNLTAIGIRKENISSLRQTRASLEAEATRLRGEAGWDTRRHEQANMEIRHFVDEHNRRTLAEFRQRLEEGTLQPFESWTPMVPSGFWFGGNALAEDGFRGRHYQNLNMGISRTTATINRQIGALYRDSKNMQEEQLRIYREKSRATREDEEDNEREREENDFSIDLRL